MSQESILGPYLKPGTPIKVGGYSTRIVRYLSEGGFSHVYIARLDIPVKGSDVAVLKRIVAPDKTALAAIRTEVETMKRLKGHRHIVTYIDSHASALKTGGFEVYVLMEYCPGGGLIDFMNTRLQTRLAEWEVLKIISDTTEAVACMHYLRPPLLHRDLKIENVLISGNGDYKLCDFGSCTEPRAAATNSQERRALEEDIQKNTTIQYRSPEMVDVSRRLPIDEKSDIWALGVLLYKLCYFTTPFEAQGQLAILNAAYTFPPYPPYTDRTKRLIAVTLQENPRDRPNIYQLLAEICAMRNVPVPIPDIYTKSRSTSSRPTSRPSSRPPTAHNDDILIYDKPDIKPATSSTHAIDIVPMRRGRPERSSSPPKADPAITSQSRRSSRPNTKGHVAVGEEVEFTTKFPSLEEMNFGLDDRTPAPSSLDYDSAAINQVGEPSGSLQEPSSMNEQDESRLRQPSNPTQSRPLPITPPHNSPLELLDLEERVLKPSEVARSGGNYMRTQPDASRIEADEYVLRNTDHQTNNDRRIPSSGPVPIVRPKPTHLENNQNIRTDLKKSTNPYAQVSTSPDDQPQIRPTMVNRASQTSPKRNQGVQTQTSPAKKEPLPRMTKEPNVSSNLIRDSSGLLISRGTSRNEGTSSMPAQSKPQFRFTTSLDRPNDNMLAQEEVMRSKSAQGARPQTIHVGSGIDFLRDLDSPLTSTTRSGSLEIVRTGGSQISHPGQDEAGPSTGYLDVQQASSAGASIRRSVSVNGPNNRHHKRPSISSIPSFSGAAKNIMNGKFSDAFKKFEASGKSRGTTPVMERSNPLMVAEDDLPAHITQHLQSSEARRSSSYSRNRPSIELLSGETVYKPKLEKTESIESTSTSVREAMRKLKEKANQKYVPQRSAQGYGKYTEPDGLHRAATVIPYSRPTTSEKSSATQIASQVHGAHKNARRYGLQDDEEDKSFSNRFPALNDDFKV